MLNVTDVCNMALAHIAKGRISNIDEQSELARQCKLFYEPTRKELLRSYTWGFAKRVSKLAELSIVAPARERGLKCNYIAGQGIIHVQSLPRGSVD